MVVFWGLVIWAVARVVSTTGSNTSTRAGNDPEQILRQRFARGEIDTEEFEHRRELLRR
jgi:putative membrane protein